MENFEKTAQKLSSILPQLREECVEFLTNKLRENNNKLSWDSGEIGEFVSVCYDGGKHPEYASNVFSSVEGVFIEDNKIYLNIEDDGKYSIDNVNTMELLDVCNYIVKYVVLNK